MAKRPELYDISIDGMRPITQKDVDRLIKTGQAYGELIEHLMRIHVKTYPDSERGKVFAALLANKRVSVDGEA